MSPCVHDVGSTRGGTDRRHWLPQKLSCICVPLAKALFVLGEIRVGLSGAGAIVFVTVAARGSAACSDGANGHGGRDAAMTHPGEIATGEQRTGPRAPMSRGGRWRGTMRRGVWDAPAAAERSANHIW